MAGSSPKKPHFYFGKPSDWDRSIAPSSSCRDDLSRHSEPWRVRRNMILAPTKKYTGYAYSACSTPNLARYLRCYEPSAPDELGWYLVPTCTRQHQKSCDCLAVYESSFFEKRVRGLYWSSPYHYSLCGIFQKEELVELEPFLDKPTYKTPASVDSSESMMIEVETFTSEERNKF